MLGGPQKLNLAEYIKERADIRKLVELYGVPLKRKTDRNWTGLCPFHDESTPSFSVNPEGQYFHCFGCNESGDVFAFVRKMDGCSFMDAMRELVQRFQIQRPERVYRNQVRQQIRQLESEGRTAEAIALVGEMKQKGAA